MNATTTTRNRYPNLKTVDYNGSGYGDIEIALYRRFGSDYRAYVDTACRAVINYERGNLNQRVRVPGTTIGGRYYPGGLRDSATVVWVWNLYPFITAGAINRTDSWRAIHARVTANPEPFTMSGNEPTPPEPLTTRCPQCDGVATMPYIVGGYCSDRCYDLANGNPVQDDTAVSGYSVDSGQPMPEPVDQLTGLTESIQQRAMLRYHLACNHFPAVDAAWIDACIHAIDLYNDGSAYNPVRVPDGYSGQDDTPYMRAIDIITGLHLDHWLDPEPEY